MTVRIYHTHECFDDCVEFIEEVIGEALRIPAVRDAFVIVHAALVTPSGERYAHAWCEETKSGHVWQRGVLDDGSPIWFAHDAAAFRAAMTVERETRYTVAQWSELSRQTGHYGPWRREYIELSSNAGVHVRFEIRLPIVQLVLGVKDGRR